MITTTFVALPTIPFGSYDWYSQVGQYPPRGECGISYFKGEVETISDGYYVDCLCWRDDKGILRGVLNYFNASTPWERAGNFSVFTDPTWQRRGIASVLLREAMHRWTIDWNQDYTPEGAAFVNSVLNYFRPATATSTNPEEDSDPGEICGSCGMCTPQKGHTFCFRCGGGHLRKKI